MGRFKEGELKIGPAGDINWYDQKGRRHRDEDKPAFINSDGVMVYHKDGQRHREGDKPAFISRDVIEYMKHDELHRDDDKPAVIYKNGKESYYRDGKVYFPRLEYKTRYDLFSNWSSSQGFDLMRQITFKKENYDL